MIARLFRARRWYSVLLLLLAFGYWLNGSWGAKSAVRSPLKLDPHVHPIAQLTARAEKQWHDLLSSQSKTLGQAYKEYRRRYGRDPPKGFDKWWEWSTAKGLKLVDEFDSIHQNLLPFWGLTPAQIEARREEMVTMADRNRLFTIKIINGQLSDDPEQLSSTARWPINFNYYGILKGVAEFLPDMNITMNLFDQPFIFVPKEERDRLINLGKAGKFVSDEEHEMHAAKYAMMPHDFSKNDYKSICDPRDPIYTSVITNAMGEEVLGPRWEMEQLKFRLPAEMGGFIHDHQAAMDPCQNPEVQWQHGGFINQIDDLRIRKHYLYPLFSWTRFPNNDDILIPTTYRFTNYRREYRDWSKQRNQVGWRGSLTGVWAKDGVDIFSSQRYRLAALTQDDYHPVQVLLNDSQAHSFKLAETHSGMFKRFMDVGVTGGVDSPGGESQIAELANAMLKFVGFAGSDDERLGAKILLDVDGWGWSARFRELMWTGSAVLKATVFKEVTTDWLVPWYHYIPIDYAYRDMYSILVYYFGLDTPDQPSHDEELQAIGRHSREWVEEHAMWDQHSAYMYRLGLEWARVMSDDRASMSWRPVSV